MQDLKSNNTNYGRIIFTLTVVMFFAYLPVSSFMFFLKNDAFTVYFPPKFFMSESIHAGQLPLWNPYINYGIPQYGDMSFGYWNPVTWLIASTVGYNAWTFTTEVLFYLVLGGIGMYKVSSCFTRSKNICMIAGIAYLCCGYNVGHLQHTNWLSGAAYLPWCFFVFHKLLEEFTIKRVIAASLLFYFLITAAHPGIIIAAVYFFFAYAVFHFFTNQNKTESKNRLLQFSKQHLILVALILLLSTAMIIAYLDIIPHFTRGEKIDLKDSLLVPTTFQSWLSMILPFATMKNGEFFMTDIAMRNVYFSLTAFLFFISFLFRTKTGLQKLLSFTGVFFLLLSTGGIFKEFAYHYLPFLGYVRLNGEFRIFSILCFIVLAVSELDKFYTGERKPDKIFYGVYYLFEILLATGIIYGLAKIFTTGDSFVLQIKQLMNLPGASGKLKGFIDAISFYDTLWIQGSIQMIVLWSIKWCIKNNHYAGLLRVCIAEVLIATLLNVPFTGAGKASVADVQKIYDRSPAGIPIPSLQPINSIDSLTTDESSMAGLWSFYNKQPGVTREAPYPTTLKTVSNYLRQLEYKKDTALLKRPLIFIEDSTGSLVDSALVEIKSFATDMIEINYNAPPGSTLVYQQSVYPHWHAYEGGNEVAWKPYRRMFLSMNCKEGKGAVRFIFSYPKLVIAMWISLIVFVILCFFWIYLQISNKIKSNHLVYKNPNVS